MIEPYIQFYIFTVTAALLGYSFVVVLFVYFIFIFTTWCEYMVCLCMFTSQVKFIRNVMAVCLMLNFTCDYVIKE